MKKENEMEFRIGFDAKDRKALYAMWDGIIDTHQWVHGTYTRLFEGLWEEIVGLHSAAFSSWSAAATCALEYYGIRGGYVMVPANTMVATPRVCQLLGNRVIYVDCNKGDLCMSADDLAYKTRALKEKTGQGPSAAFLVHVGGHLAFESRSIAKFCLDNKIILLEDCAHAHGAEWGGLRGGGFGKAGFYSFYATKTVSTGEGGMLVTADLGLWDYAKKWRGYGKMSDGEEVPRIMGLNHRMSEFTAALGVIAAKRLYDVVEWKNEWARKHLDPIFSKEDRLIMPAGMKSGLYKYIVFRPIPKSTGRVYGRPVYKISEVAPFLNGWECPVSEWIAQNHWCVPLFYKGDEKWKW